MKRFLKSIDTYLLKNHPLIWSTCVHQFLAWWLLAATVLFTLFFLQNPLTYSRIGEIIGWLILLSVTGLVLWLIFMLRFNKFKSFGNYRLGDGWTLFFISFFVIGLLALLPFSTHAGRWAKVRMQFTEQELVKDINTLNLAWPRISHEEHGNMVQVDSVTSSNSEEYEAALRNDDYRMKNADSFVKKDGAIVFYNYHRYEQLSLSGKTEAYLTGIGLYTGKQVYNVLKKGTHSSQYSDIRKLINKYVPDAKLPADLSNFVFADPHSEFTHSIEEKVNKAGSDLQNNLFHIVEARHFTYGSEWEYIPRIWYYFVFCLALLLYVYKNTTLKTFGVSFGIGIVLPVLVMLLVKVLNLGSSMGFFGVSFTVYLIFAVGALSILGNNRRNIFQGMALNYFTVCTPFLGIFLAGWNYANVASHFNPQAEVLSKAQEYIKWGEWMGMLLFVLLLEPLFQRLYLRWYSAPEE